MDGGGCGSNSCLMAFGDNTNGLCPMMMMPPVTSHPNTVNNDNTLFLPLPPNNNIHQDQNQNRHGGSGSGSSSLMLQVHNSNTNSEDCYFMDQNRNNNDNNNDGGSSSVKAKIMAHPHYHRLLAAYVNCQKIGAPPEVVARLEEACASAAGVGRTGTGCVGEDPALDQFMEAYCEMLIKYEQELSKPFKEAMVFLSRIECQFKALTVASSDTGHLDFFQEDRHFIAIYGRWLLRFNWIGLLSDSTSKCASCNKFSFIDFIGA